MAWYKEIWTYLLVSAITVLIWFWAAGETREPKRFDFARVQFAVPDQSDWIITPSQQPVSIVVEGSKLAIQHAETLFRRAVIIGIQPAVGRQGVDLLDRLRQSDNVRATGVNIRSVEPTAVELDVDRIESVDARVKPVLPGVQTEGDVVIEPAEVKVAIPGRARSRLPQSLTVEAFVDRIDLDRLEPGVRQTLECKLRLPEGQATGIDAAITPSRATVSLAIRSRTREVKLESVRVQIAGPPEDRDAYLIEVDPRQLRDVKITADADLVRRIESNEVPVVAIVHISSREKEAHIDSKRVTEFMALVPEPAGGTRGVMVSGKVNDSTEMPLIKLKITDRLSQ